MVMFVIFGQMTQQIELIFAMGVTLQWGGSACVTETWSVTCTV